MEVKSWAGYATQERRMSVVLVEPVCMERMMDVTKEPSQAAQQSQPLDPGIQHDIGISCLAWSKVWPMASKGKHHTAPSNAVGHALSNIWHCPGRKPTRTGRVSLPVGRRVRLSGWRHNSATTGANTAMAWPVDQSKQAASPLQGQARPAMDPPETESTLR